MKSLAENHDASTVALDKPCDTLTADPCPSVAVGNHNAELSAVQTAFQYGAKSWSLEGESTGIIGNDFGIW